MGLYLLKTNFEDFTKSSLSSKVRFGSDQARYIMTDKKAKLTESMPVLMTTALLRMRMTQPKNQTLGLYLLKTNFEDFTKSSLSSKVRFGGVQAR